MNTDQTVIDEIMQLEQEISEKQQQVVQLKKQFGHLAVADYTFQGADETAITLSALFGEHDDLIVVHNMGQGCSYCTLWADGFNGVYPHLVNRAGFVIISPDTPEEQAKFAQSRGWQFKMVSAAGTTFIDDMGFTWDEGTMPGASIFKKANDGTITRVSKTYFGPGDPFCGVWHLFDLLEDGPNGWQPQFQY